MKVCAGSRKAVLRVAGRSLFIVGTFASVPALAQNSVVIYGIVDSGLSYQSSQTALGSTGNGHAAVKTTSGEWAGSRLGFNGSEDLGGGTRAIFTLENGFNVNSGAMSLGGLFARQAFVGLANDRYGTVTLGRQYTPYYLLALPYSPTKWNTGGFGAHPGDIDGLDSTYRVNNALVYTSPSYRGLKVSGMYALAGLPGTIGRGSTWSAALQYIQGAAGLAVGVMRVNNSTLGGGAWGTDSTTNSAGLPGISAVNNGYQLAAAQQRVAVAGGYELTSKLGMSFSYANVQYIPGTNSKFSDTAIFNVMGANVHYAVTPAITVAVGYSYTAATRANRISDAARYNQVSLAQSYSFSKRTMVYALEGYTRAVGNTLGSPGTSSIVPAAATVADGFNAAPSATSHQFAAAIGLLTRF
ncbi:porin [Burkholderia anthina]|uniref:porin n=1 Tax=Burkholderia anthina TaxID=179879 RepID=UPI00158CD113|nr:porin [Burkholderia anthina]